ncbi:hypoxia inducible factor 1 subunit alpha, like isoform X1 [Acanthochromis polyacanthus]|uniref:hypoxia inducible factor 1 subunit alpha, like isoform X1 n=2 Tax=Acanthochromis polyacanthus TaxID=80966 RepID=UPI002234BA25|nr:hypoxia inducible factor 1 subunit alpha, like isoform X1 [Acanthochromis polyacanthus]
MEKRDGTGKRTNSEQRKLRSRDAARCRRSQETEIFYELARTLPLPRRVSAHLDKAAIMRVALSFLKMQQLLEIEDEEMEMEEESREDLMDSFYPQTLAGFVMVMTEEGDMIYLTENVSKHIGIAQLELLGQSIYEFIHPCDQEELRDLLTPRPGLSKKSQPSQRNFFLRMKSTLTSRGRTVNIKSASWKVLHCTGHIRPFGVSSSPPAGRVMTLLCEPIPHPSSVEFPLDSFTFLTRHSMDMRFTHCEGRVKELVGYKPDNLIGRSVFEFHHALDSDHVGKSIITLLSKGQMTTSYYRFLANSGGFVWAETQATVLYSNKTSQPEAVVCLNFILSSVEQPDVIFSIEQNRCGESESQPAAAPETSGASEESDSDLGNSANLFMKLQEKPEELLQLAPSAGDAIVLLNKGSLELSFASPSSPTSVQDPQELCSPQLRQLLSPIFSPLTPPLSSSASSPELLPITSEEEDEEEEEEEDKEVMDTREVEKFFAIWPEDDKKKQDTVEGMEVMDLDMLAPYISMDDDFQLTLLSNLPEVVEKPSTSSCEPSPATPAVTLGRKRTHTPDDEELLLPQMMIPDKKPKQDPPSIEEELLFTHKLLGSLEEADPSDLLMDSGPKHRSRLLTDRDPVLGGVQGLCDTAALMKNIFLPRPPDLSPPLSPMT